MSFRRGRSVLSDLGLSLRKGNGWRGQTGILDCEVEGTPGAKEDGVGERVLGDDERMVGQTAAETVEEGGRGGVGWMGGKVEVHGSRGYRLGLERPYTTRTGSVIVAVVGT